MRKEFSYLERNGQLYPIIEVTLKYSNKKIAIRALIDSGASFSVFHSEIAEYLGISIEKGKKLFLTGIGGRILGYMHFPTLILGSTTFQCKIVFSPEYRVSFNLLGRDNFFLPFKICFLEEKKKIVISDN